MFSAFSSGISALVATRFQKKHSGFSAVAFGVALIPTVVAIGVAIDYSTASSVKTSLSSIANAAALSGVSNQAISQSAGPDDRLERVSGIVSATFAAQIDSNSNLKFKITSQSTETQVADNVITTKMCYSASTTTSFLSLAGVKTIDMASCAHAAASLPPS